jgi:hypothetical protein
LRDALCRVTARAVDPLLADALDAEGLLLSWLKGVHCIDVMVRLSADRRLCHWLARPTATARIAWQPHTEASTV